MIYEKCKEILLREAELVKKAYILHENVRLAVFNREWDELQERISALNEIENAIASVDSEREDIFTAFENLLRKDHTRSKSAQNDSNLFYSVISNLSEEKKDELNAIYRSLKMETLKLRLSNETLTTYLAGIRSVVGEFLDLAFPERAGRVYTQQGTHTLNDMRSMIVNQRF